MNDALSTPTPALHDGMAVIQELDRNHLMLVRDHEENHPGPVAFGAGSLAYDPIAGGGTSNLIFDLALGRFISSVPSISGTIRNCSGGVTPWGTWYTCEEVEAGTTTSSGLRHAYVFEVGPAGPLPGNPIPFPDMGNFSRMGWGRVQPRRPMAVCQHSDSWRHVRNYRPVAVAIESARLL